MQDLSIRATHLSSKCSIFMTVSVFSFWPFFSPVSILCVSACCGLMWGGRYAHTQPLAHSQWDGRRGRLKARKPVGWGEKNDLISQGDVEERKVVQSHSPALMHRQVPSQFLSKRWLTSQTPLLYFVAEHSVIWHCMSGFTCERWQLLFLRRYYAFVWYVSKAS